MGKNILVGVCGGIAAYKTCELIRILKQGGHSVKVVMTDSAMRFVTPLTFQTLSGNFVYSAMFNDYHFDIEHVSLGQWADLVVIAPLSANTLGKISQGICDNLLTTVVSALPHGTKVICAPAMNTNMWKNPFIQENVKKLVSLPHYLVMAPGEGELACGAYGAGRMPEISDIVKKIDEVIA